MKYFWRDARKLLSCHASAHMIQPSNQQRTGAFVNSDKPIETTPSVAGEDFEKMSGDLTRAKNLLVRLWDKHPAARAQIEGATGSWFAWGHDRDASVQPVPANLSDERPPIKWPKARDVGRLEDMSPDGFLRVGIENDGDAYVSVWTESGGGVEFCASSNGGGRSRRTRESLLALMVAMEADNAQNPRRDWWAQRNLVSSTPTKGGQAA